MVQVANADGDPVLVFRLWFFEEMCANTRHLPEPKDGGRAFGVALIGFCREFALTFPELKRLFTLKLGPVEMGKIGRIIEGQERLKALSGRM